MIFIIFWKIYNIFDIDKNVLEFYYDNVKNIKRLVILIHDYFVRKNIFTLKIDNNDIYNKDFELI